MSNKGSLHKLKNEFDTFLFVTKMRRDEYVLHLETLKTEMEASPRKIKVLLAFKKKFAAAKTQFKAGIDQMHQEAEKKLQEFSERFVYLQTTKYSLQKKWTTVTTEGVQELDEIKETVLSMETSVEKLVHRLETEVEAQIGKDFKQLQSNLGIIQTSIRSCVARSESCKKVLHAASALHRMYKQLVQNHDDLVGTFQQKYDKVKNEFLRYEQQRKVIEQNSRIGYISQSSDTTKNINYGLFLQVYGILQKKMEKNHHNVQKIKALLPEEEKNRFKQMMLNTLQPLSLKK